MSVEVEDYYSVDFRKTPGGPADVTKAYPADFDIAVEVGYWMSKNPEGRVTVNLVHNVTETIELGQSAFAQIERLN